MKAFNLELQLISLIDNNYEHIQQLETLGSHYKIMKEKSFMKEYPDEYNLTQEQIDRLYIITRTTHNSHYDMRLFTSSEFQNPDNVISAVLVQHSVRAMPDFKQELYNKS